MYPQPSTTIKEKEKMRQTPELPDMYFKSALTLTIMLNKEKENVLLMNEKLGYLSKQKKKEDIIKNKMKSSEL
jgi:hypothetical protein